MTEQSKKTSPPLIQIALVRAVNSLDSSTRALLDHCSVAVSNNGHLWHVVIVAPNTVIWKRVVKRLEALTRRLDMTMSRFLLGVCRADDLMPNGGGKVGIVQRKFWVGEMEWAQFKNPEHNSWIEVMPIAHLTKIPPPPLRQEDEDLDMPF